MRPKNINIFGLDYKVIYCKNAYEVDAEKTSQSLGQIDYMAKTIHVYETDQCDSSILTTLLHECIHGITQALHMDILDPEKNVDAEKNTDLLAMALSDMFLRNGWLKE